MAVAKRPFGDDILFGSPSLRDTWILLGLTLGALLLAAVTFIVDRLRWRIPEDARKPARAHGWFTVLFFRILFLAVMAALLYPGVRGLVLRLSGEWLALSTFEGDLWMHTLIIRTLGLASNDVFVPLENVVGVGDSMASPFTNGQSVDADPLVEYRILWALLLGIILAAVAAGGLLGLCLERSLSRKGVMYLILFSGVVWLVTSLVVAFTPNTRLPFESSPLVNKWITTNRQDSLASFFTQTDPFPELNESRLLENFFVPAVAVDSNADDIRAVQLSTIAGFGNLFCDNFNSFLPGASPLGGAAGVTVDADSERDADTEAVASDEEDPEPIIDTTEVAFPSIASGRSAVDRTAASGMRRALSRQATSDDAAEGVAEGDGDEEGVTEDGDAAGDDATEQDEQAKAAEDDAAIDENPVPSDDEDDEEPFASDEAEAEETPVPASQFGDLQPLSRELAGEVLMTYFVGKTLGDDEYISLGKLALPTLALGPVIFGQALSKWWLSILVLPWFVILMAMSLFGTGATLRRATAVRNMAPQLVEFCGHEYLIDPTDTLTRRRWDIEKGLIGLILGVLMLRAFTWLWIDTDYAQNEDPTVSASFREPRLSRTDTGYSSADEDTIEVARFNSSSVV